MHNQGIQTMKQLETLKYQRLQAIQVCNYSEDKDFRNSLNIHIPRRIFLRGTGGWGIPGYRVVNTGTVRRVSVESETTPSPKSFPVGRVPHPCNPISKDPLPKNRWYMAV